METGGVIVDGRLDPSATTMLKVISGASLVVAIDVQLQGDSSLTTIWATPSRAVITSSLEPDLVDIQPVRLARIPETLSDIILLQQPQATAEAPVSVSTMVMAAADTQRDDPARARATLAAAGLTELEVERVLAFQSPATRRWRISSTWATQDGQRMAELRGLDAGLNGQWLIEMTGQRDGPGQMTFLPQGDGDVLRALRAVLPRQWVGTALNPQPASRASSLVR
jgi:hypothetical protein